MQETRCGMSDLRCRDWFHPSNLKISILAFLRLEFSGATTYVGNLIVVRMPPGQALFGKLTLSTVLSEQRAALSPPKFLAV